MRTTDSISSYSSTDLKTEARGALSLHTCPEDNKSLRVREYEVQVSTGKDTRLHIIGECKAHQYTIDIYHRL